MMGLGMRWVRVSIGEGVGGVRVAMGLGLRIMGRRQGIDRGGGCWVDGRRMGREEEGVWIDSGEGGLG